MHVNKLEYGNKQVNSGVHNQLQGKTCNWLWAIVCFPFRTSIACFPFPFRTSVIALQFTEVLKHYIAICFLYTDSISKPDAVRIGIYLNTLKCACVRSQIMFTVRWKGYNDSEGANNYSNRAYTYDLYKIWWGNVFNEFDCVIHYLATRSIYFIIHTVYLLRSWVHKCVHIF